MKKNLKSVLAVALMLSATFSTYAAKAGKVISRDSARTKSAASKKQNHVHLKLQFRWPTTRLLLTILTLLAQKLLRTNSNRFLEEEQLQLFTTEL